MSLGVIADKTNLFHFYLLQHCVTHATLWLTETSVRTLEGCFSQMLGLPTAAIEKEVWKMTWLSSGRRSLSRVPAELVGQLEVEQLEVVEEVVVEDVALLVELGQGRHTLAVVVLPGRMSMTRNDKFDFRSEMEPISGKDKPQNQETFFQLAYLI